MWTGKAGRELSMHVCVSRAPAGTDRLECQRAKYLFGFSIGGPKCSDDGQSVCSEYFLEIKGVYL